jgi:hypothetical protein
MIEAEGALNVKPLGTSEYFRPSAGAKKPGNM